METTSLRELTFDLLWPRNGVGLREVLELAVAAAIIDAIILSSYYYFYLLKLLC